MGKKKKIEFNNYERFCASRLTNMLLEIIDEDLKESRRNSGLSYAEAIRILDATKDLILTRTTFKRQ